MKTPSKEKQSHKKNSMIIPLILVFIFMTVMVIYVSSLMYRVAVSNTNAVMEDRILSVNWFSNVPKDIRYPSYNVDNSGYLLIELTGELGFSPDTHSIIKNNKRKLYFYDEEGRGYFDNINDICDMSRTQVKENAIDIIYIDYLGLICILRFCYYLCNRDVILHAE